MSTVHLIDNLESLRALSDPLKVRIIDALRPDPLTASQVAKRLGEKPTKLYYHVSELEKTGLIRVVETRQKGNLLETYYAPVAHFFRVDPALFEKGPEALGAFYQFVSGLLNQSAMDLRTAIDAGRVTEAEAAAARRHLIHSRLSREDAEEFGRRFDALLAEFGPRTSPDAEVPINLTLLFYTEKPA